MHAVTDVAQATIFDPWPENLHMLEAWPKKKKKKKKEKFSMGQPWLIQYYDYATIHQVVVFKLFWYENHSF